MDKLLIAKSEPLWNTDKRIISLIGRSNCIVICFASFWIEFFLPSFDDNDFYARSYGSVMECNCRFFRTN